MRNLKTAIFSITISTIIATQAGCGSDNSSSGTRTPSESWREGRRNVDNSGNIVVVGVSASNNDGHLPEWTLDSFLDDESRWSAEPLEGIHPWIQYDFSNRKTIDLVNIAFYRGHLRKTHFTIETSLNGTNWAQVFSGSSSGNTSDLESFSFTPVAAKFIRIIGNGNTESAFTSILEVKIPGMTVEGIEISDYDPGSEDNPEPPDPDDEVQPGDGNPEDPVSTPPQVGSLPVDLLLVTDSNNDGHLPEYTVDGDLSDDSRWSAQPDSSESVWIKYDLSGPIELTQFQLAFFRGSLRYTYFDVLTTYDDTNWTLVFSGSSSSVTDEFEIFDIDPTIATSIKVVGYGNSESDWTSIREIEIPDVNKSDFLADVETPVEPTPDPEPETGEDPAPDPEDTPATGDIVVNNSSELIRALDSVTGGEVILLKDGNYGQLTISKQYSDYVILRAENLFGAIFSDIGIDGSNKGYVHFDRILSAGIDARNNAHHLKYTNSKFSSTVYFKYADNVVIESNTIDVDGGLHALLVNSVSNFKVINNYITNAQEDLMRVTGDSPNGLIENNVFYDTKPLNIPHSGNACEYQHTDGLQMFGLGGANPRNITIRGNYFYDNPDNNAIRPTECVSGKSGVRLTMQGIFMSDPSGNGYEDMTIEQNFLQIGSPNTIYINGATKNVSVKNNTLLTWSGGAGGSIRVVEKAGKTNSGLTLSGNVSSAVSDETTALSNGMQIGDNFVYERNNTASTIFKNKIFEGAGEGSRWQHFLPVSGSPIDFGTGYGALDRLSSLKDGSETVPKAR
ncbi:discoidin domain-containing protein [Microbulbifer sp. ALW1]|uniref:discoidin domain-containing protein n=1 Tax=Microbulbifer sp. (strain ALW1) TaxID=1516059 RepID=UPI00135B936F|nr:discoidin domain-containing protein [Microbulbifer sp. ALW1]